jgi:hypothetical protein
MLWSAVIHHRFAFGFAGASSVKRKKPKRRESPHSKASSQGSSARVFRFDDRP